MIAALAARLRAVQGWQVTLSIALLALGFLIAAQLAAERPRVRYTTQERQPLVETALGLQSDQDALKARILELREEIGRLELSDKGSAALVRQLNEELDQARLAAGLVPLTGSGFVLLLEDSDQPLPPGEDAADYRVTAYDVRDVVDEIWLAGAEAVAVNGERVTPTTAIIEIGGSILVNSAYLAPPYSVTAIGPPELYERLGASDAWTSFLRLRAGIFGIRVSLATPESVDMPAFAGTVTLRYARPTGTAEPSPTIPVGG